MKENGRVKQIIKNIEAKKYTNAVEKILQDFYLIFENTKFLLKLEPYLEKLPEESMSSYPILKLLKARVYSVKYQNEKFEKELEGLNPEKLSPELRDFYYYIVAAYYFSKKNFNLALKLIQMGLEFSDDSKQRKLNKFIKYKLKNLEAVSYAIKDRYNEAIKAFEESLNIGDELKIWEISQSGYEGILSNLATAYFLKGDFRKSIEIFESLLTDVKDKDTEYKLLRKLALCYLNIGDIDKAKILIKNALEYLESQNNNIEYYYIFIYMTMVEIYIIENKLKKAEEYLEKMKNVNEKYDFLDVKNHILLLEARFNIITNNIDRALNIIDSMEEITRASILAEVNLYKALISFAKSDNKNAEFYFNKALNMVPPDSHVENTILGFYFLFIYKTNSQKINFLFKNIFKNKNYEYISFFIKTESKFYPFKINPEEISSVFNTLVKKNKS